MSAPQRIRTGAHYIWKVAGKPVSIHLSMDVVQRLRPDPVPSEGRGLEVGGILLGYIRQLEDGFIIAVEDFELVECEHARGESWTLSRRDRAVLESRLRKLSHRKRDEPEVVGWFRTHTRPGLYLDQKDFELFREYFAHPAAIALIIESDENPPVAGFFFWEDGDIERRRTYKPFPFAVDQLAAEALSFLPAPRPAAPVVPMPAAAPRRTPAPGRWKKAVLLAPIAAGLAFGVFWDPKPLRRSGSADVSKVRTNETPEPRAVFEPPPPPPETGDYTPPPEDLSQPVEKAAAPTTKPVRKLIVPAKRTRAPEPVLAPQAPVITALARFEGLPPVRHSPPRATATIEPVRVSTLRRAVGSIPGLGFLKRNRKATDNTYVPPKPVREVRPLSPVTTGQEIPVKVRVTVSPKGEVERAELVSNRVAPEIASLALDAARKWRFEPAREDEKPVSSELILRFDFGVDSGDGS